MTVAMNLHSNLIHEKKKNGTNCSKEKKTVAKGKPHEIPVKKLSWVIRMFIHRGIRYHKMTPSFIFEGIQMVSTNSSNKVCVHLHLNRAPLHL